MKRRWCRSQPQTMDTMGRHLHHGCRNSCCQQILTLFPRTPPTRTNTCGLGERVRLTLRTVTVTSSSVVRDMGLSFLIGLRGPFCASASTVTAQCWTREPSAAESGARSSLRSLSVPSAKLSLLFILLSHLRAGASPTGWL